MTGRAAGFCAGYPTPGYTNQYPGRGFGMGWGRGFGRGRSFGRGLGLGFRRGRGGCWGMPYAAPTPPYGGTAPGAYGAPYGGPTPQQEMEALKGQAEYFADALDGIRKRIAELDNEDWKTP